jgi:hypothetical protein
MGTAILVRSHGAIFAHALQVFRTRPLKEPFRNDRAGLSLVPFAIEAKEAERRQAQKSKPPHQRVRLAPNGVRSPTGVPLRRLRQRTNAAAQFQAHFLGRG